jgi:hypothetical protein
MRTSVQLMIGYSDMLLEDTVGPKSARRRTLLKEVLSAARDVLGSIQRALPATGAQLRDDDLAVLYASLREPQARILRATEELLEPTEAPLDEPFVSDLWKIRDSALKLLPVQASAATDHGSDPGAVDQPARILVVDDLEDELGTGTNRGALLAWLAACVLVPADPAVAGALPRLRVSVALSI